MIAAGFAHGAEIRRCLVQVDVEGMMKLWKHIAPQAPERSPAQALVSIHMARVEMKHLPKKLKEYSTKWLADQGIQKIDGIWTEGLPKPIVIAESVGISSRGVGNIRRPINEQVELYMLDGLETARAKGVTDPTEQRNAMLKRRADYRFKKRLI